ncbi:MAG: copper chaperone PCu(A)C [Streptosporangiaceae bacterium]
MSARAIGLARAAAAPAACAAVLIGLLSAWVSAGGAGTITKVRIEVTLAAIPMTSFVSPASHSLSARTYLTIRNLSGSPDELTGARTPAARRVTLPPVAIPAHGTVTLTPFGADLTLIGPRRLRYGAHVPLTLVFRHAGRITVQATVTAPGTP